MKDSKIIRPWFSGLGDSLQFSTLPERFSKLGFNVYISDQTSFRNQEIYNLVWGINPFVKGLSKEGPNAGDIPGYKYENVHGNFIYNVEAAHGLDPQFSYPKIYLKPERLWKNRGGLIELSYDSLNYNQDYVLKSVLKIMAKHENIPFAQILSEKQKYNIVINNIQKAKVSSLLELYNTIYSCSVFISLSSGAHMLAGALKYWTWSGRQYCILPEYMYETMTSRKLFILPNVKYIKENE